MATASGRKPGRRKNERGDISRAQILSISANLFAKQGYSATTIAQISAACGLPVGSIYWHFGSKSALLWAVTEHGAVAMFEGMPRASDFSGAPLDRFEQMLKAMRGILSRNSAFARMLIILSTIEHEDDEAARASASHVAMFVMNVWRDALRPIFAPDGEAEGLKLADDIALLLRAVVLGAFVVTEGRIEEGRFDQILGSFFDLVRVKLASIR